jgi:hypothetical protein
MLATSVAKTGVLVEQVGTCLVEKLQSFLGPEAESSNTQRRKDFKVNAAMKWTTDH